MKNLLTFILIHLVDNPDDVEVIEQPDEYGTQYFLKVNQADVGKIIGKGGRVIQAIRSLAKVRAMKEQTKIRIQILEDESTLPQPPVEN